MNEFAGVSIRPEAYERLLAICSDGELPQSFGEWAEIARADTLEARDRGAPQALISLDVDDFTLWCSTVGLVPCTEALRAFVVVQRARAQRQSGRTA
jgi:hypothetical protein